MCRAGRLFPTAAGTHFLFTRPHTSTSKVSYRCASLTAIIRDLHHQAGSESGSASAACRTVAVQLRGNGTDLDTIHRLLGLSSLSAIRAWLGSFDVIALDTAIASRAVEIGKHKRIRLPDATVWASAQVHSLLLVSSNTQDFPADEPGVREPYKLYERRAAAGAWESAHGERRQRHDGFYVWIWIDAALDAVAA